jgi:hypothetical protein
MKHLIEYKLFESKNFFNPSSEIRQRLEKYIEQKMSTTPELPLSNWIYHNIIRKSSDVSSSELKDWVKNNSQKFETLCDKYLDMYKSQNDLIRSAQDPQGEWLGINFNPKLKVKDIKGGKEVTYNYYLTFTRSPDNFKKWINSLSDLITRLYNECKSGELKDSAISMKFGYNLGHYLSDNDHMKFYWYKVEDESKVENIINSWLDDNKIGTEERPYTKGIDSGSKSSWGTLVSDKVSEEFEKLLQKNGNKFTPKQYSEWIINMLNTTKFKF